MAAVMVRAQALRGYRYLVADLGGDSTRLLRRAGSGCQRWTSSPG